MTPEFKKYGPALIWLITAIVILASALMLKNTGYENKNIWLYILALGGLLATAFEIYSKTKDKS